MEDSKYAQLTHRSMNKAVNLFMLLEEGYQEQQDWGSCFGAELLPKQPGLAGDCCTDLASLLPPAWPSASSDAWCCDLGRGL